MSSSSSPPGGSVHANAVHHHHNNHNYPQQQQQQQQQPPLPQQQRIGDYLLFETVGKGSFGKVKRGIHIPTGERVAVKILNRQKLKNANMDKKIKREINILKLFRHPNICRLYEVLQTQEDIFLIMEYIDGGELYDYIVKMGQLKEDAARYVFQQIICAIEYCHHFRVVHRDLKPENILLGQNLQVKIIDFGLSNLMRDGDFLATSCGSPNYAAPEVISGKLYCGPEVDVWSAGVVLYALLCGCLPFDEDSIPQLFAKIKKGRYDVPPTMSSGARGLLAQLLTVDPLHRATIPQVRDNVWFNHRLPPHLSLSAVVYHEADRIQQYIIRDILEMLNRNPSPNPYENPRDQQQVRADVMAKRGRAYVAYCVYTDALRRRELLSSSNAFLTIDQQQQQQNHNGGDNATTSGGSGSNAASKPCQQTAAQRELNLGLILTINPAIEAMLDTGDATVNKDLYNTSTFLPVSNRSAVGAGLVMGTPQLSSSHGHGTVGRSAQGYFGSANGGSTCDAANVAPGASGFSLTRRSTLSAHTTTNGCSGSGTVGSLCGGMGQQNPSEIGSLTSGSLRNHSTTLSRFSPQTRATPPTTAIENPRVGSVAKTNLVYNAAEAQVALAYNAGWRVGIMTNYSSNAVMAELYDVLVSLDMCWKVLSPYRIAAKFNNPPRNELGVRRYRMMLEATQKNAEAIKIAEESTAMVQQLQRAPSPATSGLLSSPYSSVYGSPSSPCGVVGASLSTRPVAITFHLFRLQEKHDKGYIIDFGVRGGEQPMVAMDIIIEIYEALRQRVG